jgi:hypothetical protein
MVVFITSLFMPTCSVEYHISGTVFRIQACLDTLCVSMYLHFKTFLPMNAYFKYEIVNHGIKPTINPDNAKI